jgi:hypothetical protein
LCGPAVVSRAWHEAHQLVTRAYAAGANQLSNLAAGVWVNSFEVVAKVADRSGTGDRFAIAGGPYVAMPTSRTSPEVFLHVAGSPRGGRQRDQTEKVKETTRMNQSLIRNAMVLLAIVFAALVTATFVAPQVVSVPTWLTLLHGVAAVVTGYAAFGEREPSRI